MDGGVGSHNSLSAAWESGDAGTLPGNRSGSEARVQPGLASDCFSHQRSKTWGSTAEDKPCCRNRLWTPVWISDSESSTLSAPAKRELSSTVSVVLLITERCRREWEEVSTCSSPRKSLLLLRLREGSESAGESSIGWLQPPCIGTSIHCTGSYCYVPPMELADSWSPGFCGTYPSRWPVDSSLLGLSHRQWPFPGLVWCDMGLVAPLVTALWLPSISTVEDFCRALELGDHIPESSTLAVETDGLQYLFDDRFKPRVGRLYFLRPVLHSDADEVALFQNGFGMKYLSPVPSDEEFGLCQDDGPEMPPIVQVRPNHEIRIPFDQDLPITRRSPDGEVMVGRIIPPPRWEENSVNRAAVSAGAQFRTASGQLTVQFRSWLVKHDNRQAAFGQSRDFTLRAQLVVRVREKLKRVWNDHIGQDDTLQVHIVHPVPFTEPGAFGALHIIAEVNRRPRSPLQPVLLAARELASLSISRPLWRAGLLPQDFDTRMCSTYACQFAKDTNSLCQYCGGPWIWGWQNCTSRAQKLEPHLLVKVHSASAPWLNHCRSQYNIRLAAEIDIVIFEWQQEGVGKQRLSNSGLKTGAGKAEVEQ